MKFLVKPLAISIILILSVSFTFYYSLVKTHSLTDVTATRSISEYDLSSPVVRLELPKILHEISGLTDIDDHTIACVQDEDGLVFIYDLQKNEIKHQFEFNKPGDYEGITRVGKAFYILRSDGKLFGVNNYESKADQVNEYDIDIPVKNNEGLAFDPANNRLLIAGKSAPKGDKHEDQRTVFGFDLSTKTVSEKPVYEFSLAKIRQFMMDNNRDQTKKAKEPKININPSAIAVHPKSGNLYVLSSKDHLMFIFNPKGDIEGMQQLDKKIFNQAEGITFLENGDMLISNEGKKDKPTLLRFSYQTP